MSNSEVDVVNDLTLRAMQLKFMNSLLKGMDVDEPSASMLAIVERFLARFSMGLVDIPDDNDLTDEERKIVKEFEELESNMDSALFTTTKQ